MKFLHISDLHLGKYLNGVSLINDQEYIFKQIFDIVKSNGINVVLIAGDIYDRSIPPVEATELLSHILCEFSELKLPVYIVGGNHDGLERLSFGSEIFQNDNIFIAKPYDGTIQKETLFDEFGEINIYLMPFVTTAQIKSSLNIEAKNLTEAFQIAMDNANVDTSKRNILVSHQFVTKSKDEMEFFSDHLGGTQNIDANIFSDTFDYIALGHIHKPYWVIKNKIRYSGSPLKYNIKEHLNTNSITIIEFKHKGSITFEEIALKPIRNLRQIIGKFNDIIEKAINTDDYVEITITDEEYIPDCLNRLRKVYPNIVKLSFDNSSIKSIEVSNSSAVNVESKSTFELFKDFYSLVYNQNIEDNPNYLRIIQEVATQIDAEE